MSARSKKAAAHFVSNASFSGIPELVAELERLGRDHIAAFQEAAPEVRGSVGLYYDDHGAARLAIIIRRT